ncbi:hypothetical protein CJD36_003685 [Flavipsychrobacter stenotrophus]|uniref:Uncharacterized protein n=1 Tax=Flavipsychrobacter stenotrophus TaxID=2077091 RepID=A0A2S7T282_9BACT|nr:hypothetical protein [Flavipsychrobacter stenotrophus]PQJ12856.1 hypothetical protein CJD36_003685 [Flavipsychrobacter stenotrophus]
MTFDTDYISDLLRTAYAVGGLPTVTPYHGNFRNLAEQLKPSKHAFFGQLRINNKALLSKVPGVVEPSTYGSVNVLCSKFKGIFQEILGTPYNPQGVSGIPAAWSESDEILQFDNILFDDLGFIVAAAFSVTYLCDFDAPSMGLNFRSLATLSGNSNTGAAVPFPAGTAALGSLFAYVPPYLSFVGYIINYGN